MLEKPDFIFKIRFVANSNSLREKGLMFADPLEDDEAVFFIFPYEDKYSFWNKNVSFPLSLAFLDNRNRILDILDMDAHCQKGCTPCSNFVKYVVEVPSGAFKKRSINVGDRILQKDKHLHVLKNNI